jgi:hypothetical protein
MPYFTKMRSKPLFSRSEAGGKNVRFKDGQEIAFDIEASPQDVKGAVRQEARLDQDDSYRDVGYKKESKNQLINEAIDFKNNRNQKISLAAITITLACFTLLGLFSFGVVAVPILPIAGFGIVETVLGVAILGFVSMLGTFAIAGTGISKELPIKKQKKTYDGVTPLDEQNARGLERTQADLKQNKAEASPSASAASPSAPLHSILRKASAKATSSRAKTGGVEV